MSTHPAWGKALGQMSPELVRALYEEGVDDHWSSAQYLVDAVKDPRWVLELANTAASLSPLMTGRDKEEIVLENQGKLELLCRLAERVPLMSSLTDAEFHKLATLPQQTVEPLRPQGPMIKHWRRYNPREAGCDSGQNMNELEKRLKAKWLYQLVGYLYPHAGALDKLQKCLAYNNPKDEMADLFGAARWGTVKQHALTLARMVRYEPNILPWTESKLVALLNRLESDGVVPNKPKSWLQTVLWIQKHVSTSECLSNAVWAKMEAVRRRLTKNVLAEPRRAKCLADAAVEALERACMKASVLTDTYAAGHFRGVLIGGTSRSDDGQHTQPATFQSNTLTICYKGWQTKVKDINSTPGRILPIVIPKLSYTGEPWWEPYEAAHHMLMKDVFMRDRDFLLPAPSKARRGFLRRPCPRAQQLRWFRDLLVFGGLSRADAMTETLPGCRVHAADKAYRLGIDKERRAQLGKWANPDNVDVYVREHEHAILDIWKTIMARRHEVPTGPDHCLSRDPDTQPPASNSDDEVEITMERPAKKYKQTKREQAPVMPIAEEQELKSFLDTEHLPKGPLRLGRNKNTLRFHLANAEDVTIGCGLSTDRKHYEHVADMETYQRLLASGLQYLKCARCFAVYDVPLDWEPVTESPNLVDCQSPASKGSTSSDSEGDSSDEDLVGESQIVRPRT
eukprot:6491561-Amphidinium_carterae.1